MSEIARGRDALDVVTTAFIARTGAAVSRDHAGSTCETACARCGRATAGGGLRVRDTVSRTFTGFDGWTDIAAPTLCRVCVWAYSTKALRSELMLVTSDPPRATTLSVARLRTVLKHELPSDIAVVVPLRPGRKHILPHAMWGRVAVDDIALPWVVTDADRLSAVIRLRRHGFSLAALGRDAPAYGTLKTLPRRTWASIFVDWDNLAPWRRRPLYLDLASTASTPTRRAL
jgi:hypothetical protein